MNHYTLIDHSCPPPPTGIPATGLNDGVKAVEKPKQPVPAGPLSDVDADLEARLDNLRRQ